MLSCIDRSHSYRQSKAHRGLVSRDSSTAELEKQHAGRFRQQPTRRARTECITREAPILLRRRYVRCLYDYSVRSADELSTYILSSTSSRSPLLTLWTASYCSSCRVIKPLLSELVEKGAGETDGGVNYCEVEFDAPDVLDSGLGMTYMVNSLPTLITFDRGEVVERVTAVTKMRNREWLKEYIERQARRKGEGTGSPGESSGTGFFGGLFGNSKR